eukprot:CAMPEP_0177648354 /NCGR_PEP_ID=MMETSP0447-20121125/10783_1 /TAXON_ID=0 /ORGANISM="Stygamoeba regulata, Strain BSH-02190019" /LENGTH=549 /DNA_ID=CAMNT_0019150989 /DNA_START=24 /DNA_END=1673 /DNA_ORIENTATION=+
MEPYADLEIEMAPDVDLGSHAEEDAYNHMMQFEEGVQGMPSDSFDDYVFPDIVKNFIYFFHRTLSSRNAFDVISIYETSFPKLTDRYFKNSSWPHPDSIAQLVGPDELFLCLYKELYYRHIYARLQPTVEQRIQSYQNYCVLFNFILDSQGVDLDLPNQWLWDIIDEFIYQFQSFCQFRSKLDKILRDNKGDNSKAEKDLQRIAAEIDLWSATSVLNYLHCLVTRSDIVNFLQSENSHNAKPDDSNKSPIYRMLGYFSLIGLLRVHCLLGDYYLALKTIDAIDLTRRGLFARVTACHVTLYYYIGFAYLMMRRYVDCIKTYSSILLYISRTKQYHHRPYQFDQISKKSEQMYAILAIAVSLCPQRIDENVHTSLRDKYNDKMSRMMRGEESVFIEQFSYACPKFVNPIPASSAGTGSVATYSQDAHKLQLKLFITEVKQQMLLPTIRSYLKLYTTIPITKLASFVSLDENVLRMQLMCLKHKSHQLVWQGGPALSGVLVSTSDVDFYVSEGMVHIATSKVARKYSDYFIRHICKFDAMVQSTIAPPMDQ